jgi:anti-anti-sigma factor
MTSPLEITETGGGPRHRVFRLTGALDTTGATLLDERSRAVLDSQLHLVLNLAQVTFISSSGIGGLVALSEDFRERGLDLRLSAPSREVVAPIELLCFDRFLTICDSDAKASAEWAA